MPGRKMLLHDGARILVTVEIQQQILRLLLGASVQEDRPFAFVLPARDDMRGPLTIVPTIVAIFDSPKQRQATARHRPNRQMMTHLRSLQALDGEAAGASHREIAATIFGTQDVFERWSTDSELRAQVRYLLRRGHDLSNTGYRRLHGQLRTRQGESPIPLDSP